MKMECNRFRLAFVGVAWNTRKEQFDLPFDPNQRCSIHLDIGTFVRFQRMRKSSRFRTKTTLRLVLVAISSKDVSFSFSPNEIWMQKWNVSFSLASEPPNRIPFGWGYNPWSRTGHKRIPQPDNAEFDINQTTESCLSVLNNVYNDGIAWHDVACYHEKPVICEDSPELLNYVGE